MRAEEIYLDILQRECALRREILESKIRAAIANTDLVTPLLPLKKGVYGRILGEVLMVFKCSKVTVHLRKESTPICTEEMPVRYNGQNYYLTPNTRMLTSRPTIIDCDSPFHPKYQLANGFWIALPSKVRVKTPKNFQLMFHKTSLKFTLEDDIPISGLYTSKELDAARRFTIFPLEKSRILTEIVQRTTDNLRSNYISIEALLSPAHFERIFQTYLQRIYGYL